MTSPHIHGQHAGLPASGTGGGYRIFLRGTLWGALLALPALIIVWSR